LAKLLTQKEKLRVKELHIKEDGTLCVYDEKELDLDTCVIAHLDGNSKNNADWNHALAHQSCNIEAIENIDYHLKAQQRIKLNHSKIYAPRIEEKNENVSTEVDINVTNRQLTKQKLTEWTIDEQKIEKSEAINSVTYLCTELTGHGSQKCIRDYISALCSPVGPFMITTKLFKNFQDYHPCRFLLHSV